MATGRGTILVIDDEEVMREVLEALLAREGYDATSMRGIARAA